MEHDLFGKPDSTFPDHALEKRKRPNLGPAAQSLPAKMETAGLGSSRSSKHRVGASRKPKMTALPQYEARARVIYFVFFLAFFFFAIVSILGVCVDPAAG
jgi:hypothetical protein